MHPKSGFVVLLLALTLNGCAYHGDTPVASAPETFSVDNTTNPSVDLPAHPWWQEIGSPELNGLVVEALDNNRQVSTASKNIEIAQSSLDTVRLGWLPSINLLGGRFSTDGIALLPGLMVPLSGSGGFLAFLPTWMANIIQLPNQTKAAEKNVEVSVADFLAMRNAIAAQVVSSYATVLASFEEEKILQALKKNLDTQVRTARSMNAQGLETAISSLEQDSQLQKLETQMAVNRANRIAARNALLTLLGRPLENFVPKASFGSLNLNYLAPGNTPTSVLSSRPDVAAARAKIQSADYGISSTASLLAPTPLISSQAIRLDVDMSTNSNVSETVQAGLIAWVLDPTIFGKINTAKKQYDSTMINYLSVVDNAIKEVDNALAEFDAKQTTLIKEELILSRTSKNLATYRAMLRGGLLSETDYLQIAGQFDLATMAMVQTKLETVISLSKLYQSMGGGATYGQDQYSLQEQTIVSLDRGN